MQTVPKSVDLLKPALLGQLPSQCPNMKNGMNIWIRAMNRGYKYSGIGKKRNENL